MSLPKIEITFTDDNLNKVIITGITFEESEKINAVFLKICKDRIDNKMLKPV